MDTEGFFYISIMESSPLKQTSARTTQGEMLPKEMLDERERAVATREQTIVVSLENSIYRMFNNERLCD